MGERSDAIPIFRFGLFLLVAAASLTWWLWPAPSPPRFDDRLRVSRQEEARVEWNAPAAGTPWKTIEVRDDRDQVVSDAIVIFFVPGQKEKMPSGTSRSGSDRLTWKFTDVEGRVSLEPEDVGRKPEDLIPELTVLVLRYWHRHPRETFRLKPGPEVLLMRVPRMTAVTFKVDGGRGSKVASRERLGDLYLRPRVSVPVGIGLRTPSKAHPRLLGDAIHGLLSNWRIPLASRGRRVAAFAPGVEFSAAVVTRAVKSKTQVFDLDGRREQTVTLDLTDAAPARVRIRFRSANRLPIDPSAFTYFVREDWLGGGRSRSRDRLFFQPTESPGEYAAVVDSRIAGELYVSAFSNAGDEERPWSFRMVTMLRIEGLREGETLYLGEVEIPPIVCEGTLVDSDGVRVGNEEVLLVSGAASKGQAKREGGVSRSTRTNSRGRFQFRSADLPREPLYLRTTGDWDCGALPVALGRRNHRLEATLDTRIAGRIVTRGLEYNRPFPHVTARLRDTSASSQTLRLDSEGRIRAPRLAEGIYDLSVSVRGSLVKEVRGLVVREGQSARPKEFQNFVIAEEFEWFDLTVLGPDGEWVSRAVVVLHGDAVLPDQDGPSVQKTVYGGRLKFLVKKGSVRILHIEESPHGQRDQWVLPGQIFESPSFPLVVRLEKDWPLVWKNPAYTKFRLSELLPDLRKDTWQLTLRRRSPLEPSESRSLYFRRRARLLDRRSEPSSKSVSDQHEIWSPDRSSVSFAVPGPGVWDLRVRRSGSTESESVLLGSYLLKTWGSPEYEVEITDKIRSRLQKSARAR